MKNVLEFIASLHDDDLHLYFTKVTKVIKRVLFCSMGEFRDDKGPSSLFPLKIFNDKTIENAFYIDILII